LANDLISQFGYFGIFLILVLGGLGLPVPEEAPIIIAGILSRNGKMHWIPALVACFSGVLVGDFVVYFLGYFYGEKVLRFPLTRKFLTKARETQIKGYFHRHGVKILILGRFAVGFRTAAYLTAGILRLPTLKLFLTDLFAASLSTFLMFGLSYAFATKVEEGFQEAKHYITPAIGLLLVIWLLHRFIKARMRAGQPVGPPVVDSVELPLPGGESSSTLEPSIQQIPDEPKIEVPPFLVTEPLKSAAFDLETGVEPSGSPHSELPSENPPRAAESVS
jgi:membrane protein DedA with SNARE-associated domain